MKKLLQFLDNLFNFSSENVLINKIKCFYYNNFEKADFKIYFEDGYFKVILNNGLILKFYGNPFRDLLHPLRGYLRNYEIKEGNCIIDGGAYIGAFSIYIAKLLENNIKIIAFEPDKFNFDKLLKNIELNNIKNIIAINKGIWNKNEILKFDNRSNKGSIMVECANDEIKGEIMNYGFIKLDDELEKLNINKVDFIKMDVEGAEIEAIEGCENILKNNNVSLAIASYHIRNGEETYKKLESILNNLGYKTKTEFPEHLTTYAHK